VLTCVAKDVIFFHEWKYMNSGIVLLYAKISVYIYCFWEEGNGVYCGFVMEARKKGREGGGGGGCT